MSIISKDLNISNDSTNQLGIQEETCHSNQNESAVIDSDVNAAKKRPKIDIEHIQNDNIVQIDEIIVTNNTTKSEEYISQFQVKVLFN